MVRPARLRPVHSVCRLRLGTDLQMSVIAAGVAGATKLERACWISSMPGERHAAQLVGTQTAHAAAAAPAWPVR